MARRDSRRLYEDRLPEMAETIKKGEALKLPQWIRLKVIKEAGLVDVSESTLAWWARSGLLPFARKIGRFWFVDWRRFLIWFETTGKNAT